MSPTAFKQQVSTLLQTLSNSHAHILTIRRIRKLGPTTTALDNLQSTLTTSLTTIQTTYLTLRNLLGSRFDLGDEISRQGLDRCIRKLREEVEGRLVEVVEKREGKGGKVGFGEMETRWRGIEEEVENIIESLGRRIEEAMNNEKLQQEERKHEKEERKQPPRCKTDEVVISLKELDILIDHMKNSWVERRVEGRSVWVNAFDEDRFLWEQPEEGFLKFLDGNQKSRVEEEEREASARAEERRRKRKDEQRREEERLAREEEERLRKEEEILLRERERREEERRKQERLMREREEERLLAERELKERERREREWRQQQHRRQGYWHGSDGW